MPEGAPPPWLINMQRYGPPTSYPKLKIPGLTAPIPAGSSYGYHPGGWGKVPIDEVRQETGGSDGCLANLHVQLHTASFIHCPSCTPRLNSLITAHLISHHLSPLSML